MPLVAVGLMYRQGYFRQRLEASGWQHEYWLDIDPDRLPGRTGPGRGRGAAADHRADLRQRGRGADLAGVGGAGPAVPARRRRARERPTRPVDHLAAVRRRRRHPALAVRAARGGRGSGARRAGYRAWDRPPQRGARRLRGARTRPRRAGPRRVAATRRWRRSGERTVFTTHTPVAAGNETYSREEIAGAIDGLAAELGHRPRRSARTRPIPCRGPRRAVRHDHSQPAHEPHGQRGEPPPRRGGARDVARAVAGPRAERGADHPRHQRRAPTQLDRSADAAPARALPR